MSTALFSRANVGECVSENESYQMLAAAIVLSAVQDYESALMWDRGNPRKNKVLQELEEFFHSNWCSFLTDVDPDLIVRKCHERAEKRMRKKIQKRKVG